MVDIDKNTQNELTRIALLMADAAGQVILPHFRATGLHAENKLSGAGFDPVTVADRAAEQAMRDILARERPQDAILGEEFGDKSGTSGLIWVLDPIDGTRGFISGTPTWGVLIALGDDDGPQLGLIDQPYIGERFFGGFGAAWMQGPHGRRELGVRQEKQLQQAILFTTFPEIGSAAERAAFQAVKKQVKLTRYGMDCYAYALLAAGQIDLVVEAGLQPYDIQAPIALIKAAGGIVTDWQGGAAHHGGRVLAAANAGLHAAAMAVLADAE